MDSKEISKLKHGLYKIYYHDGCGGGYSLASVGSTHSGKRWFAPCNWTSSDEAYPAIATTNWESVHHVTLIVELDYDHSQRSGQY